MLGAWTVMLHGEAFLQYNAQGGDRGDRQFGSINWGMAMASRDFGAVSANGNATNRLTLRTMLSLDPATVTERGYPLLLQSGESYKGAPLHDRQHPHDLFMELAALYDRQLTPNLGVELYAAPVGEPASGPVAFMHRPSAANDPFAPISHHWQDATHISFGVLTAGFFTKMVKLEGSWFNGREPDENRYDFDFRRFDSYAGRFTINPNAHWSLEGSYAFLKSPEALTPDESEHRVTAAAMYGRRVGTMGDWSTSFVYGANKHADAAALSNSVLAETNLVLDAHNTIFGRAEYVQKSAADLALAGFSNEQQFNVGALAVGYVRELLTGRAGSLGLGARGTINVVPETLRPTYGTRTPLGLGVFVRYRPNKMRMDQSMNMNGMHHGMPSMPMSPQSPAPDTMPMDHSTMPGMAMPHDSARTGGKPDTKPTAPSDSARPSMPMDMQMDMHTNVPPVKNGVKADSMPMGGLTMDSTKASSAQPHNTTKVSAPTTRSGKASAKTATKKRTTAKKKSSAKKPPAKKPPMPMDMPMHMPMSDTSRGHP